MRSIEEQIEDLKLQINSRLRQIEYLKQCLAEQKTREKEK